MRCGCFSFSFYPDKRKLDTDEELGDQEGHRAGNEELNLGGMLQNEERRRGDEEAVTKSSDLKDSRGLQMDETNDDGERGPFSSSWPSVVSRTPT
ncbi:hypothetical protein EYF80_029174 [Liparis tanakae]|uniref:Uncharacterized protein n=1 Tax=Liparis tanakae TaxID=230148 RepID=A0A4Z2H6E7_9TELE|nr:hypothetical protein EYF80_029174 [Liparis tanakae]